MEIKCDLDVTDNRANECNLEYLTTIVTMLKNVSTNRVVATFYGTTALVSQKMNRKSLRDLKLFLDIIIIKNILFTGSWFLIFIMLISYLFS